MGSSASWNPLGLPRPLQDLFYFLPCIGQDGKVNKFYSKGLGTLTRTVDTQRHPTRNNRDQGTL